MESVSTHTQLRAVADQLGRSSRSSPRLMDESESDALEINIAGRSRAPICGRGSTLILFGDNVRAGATARKPQMLLMSRM